MSRRPGLALHLGLEENIREKISDPEDHSVQFSLHLDHTTVRDILDAICKSDDRYTWSPDGSSINVYPLSRVDDKTDLMNFKILQIHLASVPDPDQALTSLSSLIPNESVGYLQAGGDNSYPEPWTVNFEDLSVRQFANRIAEHMGKRTSWIWQGGKDSRMFTFLKGGFY